MRQLRWFIPGKSSFAVLALAAALCLCHMQAAAWSSGGHMLAALLAWRQLTPQEQQRAADILRHLPSFDHDIGKSVAGLPPAQQNKWIFAMAAIWPDLIKAEKHPAHELSRPGWHTTWMPIGQPGYPLPAKRAKAGHMDTMDALPRVMREFADSKTSATQRAVDLAWILHMTGDLHQPLHSSSYYSSQWPAGDATGSRFRVRVHPNDPPTVLHKVWDGLFAHKRQPNTGVEKDADSIASDPQLSRQALKPELQKQTPQQWIEENRDVAARDAYFLGTKSPLQGISPRAAKAEQAPLLPAGYIKHARQVGRKRLALAGDRIADFLHAHP